MSPTAPVRRLRLGLPRRVFSQILLMQVAIAAGVAVLATGLFLAPLGEQLDDQAMRRALAIAQTTAQQPQIAEDLRATEPTPGGPVQREAERIRRATGAEYVVVLDRRGVRWSHTDPERIGGLVSTDPGEALAGREVMEIDEGTLGRSARGKVPAAGRRRRGHRSRLGRHRLRQRPRAADPRHPGVARLRGRRPRGRCARGLADLPAGPAADP